MSTQKSETLPSEMFLLPKTYKALDEKVQTSYVSWYWRVMQSLKRNWFLVQKMTRRIWWILMWAVASLKISTLMCYFCRKYIMFEPKSTEELCVITLENDAKFEEELTCALKNDMRNLANFWPNFWKSQNLHFNGLFLNQSV